MIKRQAIDLLHAKVKPGKVLIVYGPRRVGKTVLLRAYRDTLGEGSYVWINGEDLGQQALLDGRSGREYRRLMGDKTYLLIDEAQAIPDIGTKLKLMVDELPAVSIVITGSAMLDLSGIAGEPLVGRKSTIGMYPLGEAELISHEGYASHAQSLERRLIYGMYPEAYLIEDDNERADYLIDLSTDYLLKDILAYDGIRNAEKIRDLLRLIALQVGSEVSVEKLGNELDMSKNTVAKYIGLLTKVFVLYKLEGFSRNLRSEITKKDKYYFYDNGIRNAIIRNFNPLKYRTDIGALWENYLIAERLKWQSYNGHRSNNYFWRTYRQQEIDWVEDYGGQLHATEFKWKAKAVKPPPQWTEHYPDANFEVVDRGNYLDWLEE
jgi:predicted AAA+ superfamily ATPase